MNETPFTIEKNITIPQRQGRITSPLSIALRQMEIGDSMLLTQRERNSAFALIHGTGIKLASRRINDEQIRIWRVS